MTYTVRAKHWSGGWELHVEGVGVTQTRNLHDASRQAADLIETYTGTAVDVTDVEVVPDLGSLTSEVRKARELTRTSERLQQEAAAESRRVVRALKDKGLTVADAAEILGVSRGRVSQLSRS